MVLEYEWDMKIYDLDGGLLGTLSECADRQIHYPLNGIDSAGFTLYLDNPMIDPNYVDPLTLVADPGDPTIIRTLDRVLKIWRTITDVTDPDAPVTVYEDDPDVPSFCGYITNVTKVGQSNVVNVVAQNPLWRLQSRFHLLNHYLVIDYDGQADANHEGGNEDEDPWDISALMFRLIDLVNGAFGGRSYTGILKPTGSAPFWPKTLEMGPFRVAKGDNTWTLFSSLLGQPGAPDIIPVYTHTDDEPDLMYFTTAEHRGTDVSGDCSFDFLTGNCNLDDLTESEDVIPDKFANYVWAIGQGGPNVSLALAEDNSGDVGYDNVGVYMHQIENESDDVGPGSILQGNADAELLKVDVRPKTYSLLVSPMIDFVYGVDFTLGDLVMLNANKGALQVSDVKQRVYEVTISLSDNCVEHYDLLIADDFFSAVPEA